MESAMTYNSSGLSAISYSNGFTLWHYRTEDSANKLAYAGYFDGASKMLRPGDFMMVNAGIKTTPAHGFLAVTSNEAGKVSVSELAPFAW